MTFRLIIAILLTLTQSATANPAICDDAARKASRESGVPLSILQAITRIETGRNRGGKTEPWPWTLNEAGHGSWFPNREAAHRHLETALRQGKRNVDIGCFQLNYRWHSQHFTSPAAMLEPLTNARYAARFLRSLYDQSGDWQIATGRYHSGTPEHASRYLARFNQALTQPIPARNRRATGPGTPLLRGGQAISAGSLLRVNPSPVPLLRGPVPRLFGG